MHLRVVKALGGENPGDKAGRSDITISTVISCESPHHVRELKRLISISN